MSQGNSRQPSRWLEQLSWLLDSAVRIPGTRIRVGLDALIGLLPVAGDAVSAALSCLLLNEAARLGAPRSVLLRMAFNILVDTVLGAIPLLGDVFDVTWRANQRNLHLLQDFAEQPQRAANRSRWFGLAIAALLLAALIGLAMLAVALGGWVWQAATGAR